MKAGTGGGKHHGCWGVHPLCWVLLIRVDCFGGGGAVNAADKLVPPPFPLDSRGWRESRRGDNADAWQSAMHLYFTACSCCRSAAAAARGYSCLLPILRVHHGGSGVPGARRAGVAPAIPSSLPGEPPGLQTQRGFLPPALLPLPKPQWAGSARVASFDLLPGGSSPAALSLPALPCAGRAAPAPPRPACSSRPRLLCYHPRGKKALPSLDKALTRAKD